MVLGRGGKWMGKWKWMDDMEVRYWMENNGFTRCKRSQRSDGRKPKIDFGGEGHNGLLFWALGVRNILEVPHCKKQHPWKLLLGPHPLSLIGNGQGGPKVFHHHWSGKSEGSSLRRVHWLSAPGVLFFRFYQYDQSFIVTYFIMLSSFITTITLQLTSLNMTNQKDIFQRCIWASKLNLFSKENIFLLLLIYNFHFAFIF